MASPRIRHATSVREAEQVRDDLITQGYKVKSEGETSTLLGKSSWGSLTGHLLVGLLTIWWTLGIGNLIYALAAHSADEVLVRVDEEHPLPAPL